MNADIPYLYFVFGGTATVLLLGYFYVRQFLVKGRVRRYCGGTLPETMNLGVVFFGRSSETGRFRKREGAVFATKDNLVFLKQGPGHEILEIPWTAITGWEAVGAFREKKLDRKIVSVKTEGGPGLPMAYGFALPRPEFWTALIDVALKTPKNPETS